MLNILSWIFSVVVVSFLVNVASNKATPYIDKQFEKLFDYQRVRNQKRKALIDIEVKRMLDDAQYFQYKIVTANSAFLEVIGGLIIVIILHITLILLMSFYVTSKLIQPEIALMSGSNNLFKVIAESMFNSNINYFISTFLVTSLVLVLLAIFAMYHMLNSTKRYILLRTITVEYFKRKALIKTIPNSNTE